MFYVMYGRDWAARSLCDKPMSPIGALRFVRTAKRTYPNLTIWLAPAQRSRKPKLALSLKVLATINKHFVRPSKYPQHVCN